MTDYKNRVKVRMKLRKKQLVARMEQSKLFLGGDSVRDMDR